MISLALLAATAVAPNGHEALLNEASAQRSVFIACVGMIAKEYAIKTHETVEAISTAAIAKCQDGIVEKIHGNFVNAMVQQRIIRSTAEDYWDTKFLPQLLQDARSQAFLKAMDARAAQKK